MDTFGSREGASRFELPLGFTVDKQLVDKATIADYEAAGMPAPKPGEYAMDNGVIAVATSEGNIAVWIPMLDTNGDISPKNKTRTVPPEKAFENLKKMGYTEGQWGVPTIL